MAKEPLTTRLDADVKREVEDYADDHDIGQTEASRRLIRAGLAAEGRSVATTDGGGMGPFERLAAPRTVLVGAVLLTLALLPFAGAGQAAATGAGIAAFGLLGLSMILMGLGLTTFWAATLANLALARPLRALVLPSKDGETT